MTDEVPPQDESTRAARQTLRLTFRVTDGQVQLINQERVDMICPLPPGEHPRAGEHGGFWMELRDARDQVLAYRALSAPIANSIEVFSPEGIIRREFGTVSDQIFEVLLPAEPQASSVALVGEPTAPGIVAEEASEGTRETGRGTRELARFDLAPEDHDDQR